MTNATSTKKYEIYTSQIIASAQKERIKEEKNLKKCSYI